MHEQNDDRNLAAVFVRPYPPFALALGMSFLTWLSGSLVLDSLRQSPRDILLAVLFLLVFLPALATALYGWVSILWIRNLGLRLDRNGVRHVHASPLGPRTRSLKWRQVESIESGEKGVLRFNTRKDPLEVSTAGLLENPEWIRERAQQWRQASLGDPGAAPVSAPESAAELKLGSITCAACGSSIALRPGADKDLTCQVCGAAVRHRPQVRASLDRVTRLIRDLPAAHRQFHQDLLKVFGTHRRKQGRTLITVAWSTAGLWTLFAAVEWLSSTLRPDSPGVNRPFLIASLGLAVLALASGILMAAFGKRITALISPTYHALAAPTVDGPARCRFCGADLPGTDMIRRCEYCGSDSIVMGKRLAGAERTLQETLGMARRFSSQSSEAGLRLLSNAYSKLQSFANFQIFWLHIPILVALDGHPAMLYRVTGLITAMLAGNILANLLGIRWLKRSLPA